MFAALFSRNALLAAALTAGVSGCATPDGSASPGPSALGRPHTLASGQTLPLPEGARLRYVEVTDDSRCRPGMQCIRAGDANVVFEFAPADGAARRVVVNTDDDTAAIGPWTLRVLELTFDEPPSVRVQVEDR